MNMPTDPRDFMTIPGMEKMPDPSISPRLSIMQESKPTSRPSGLVLNDISRLFSFVALRISEIIPFPLELRAMDQIHEYALHLQKAGRAL